MGETAEKKKQIKNYTLSKNDTKTGGNKSNKPNKSNDISPLRLNVSWIDLFFTHNISIFGVGLGFEELDVWTLLSYRAELMYKYGKKYVNNRIKFYYRVYEPEKTKDQDKKFKQKIDLQKTNAIKLSQFFKSRSCAI